MNFNEIILDLRKERGISQQQVAEAIGISQSTIAKIEIGRNEATASTIRKLADFFGVSSDYILGLSEDFGSVSVQSSAPALSAEEKELLSLFRKMTSGQKTRVTAFCEGVLSAPEKNKMA